MVKAKKTTENSNTNALLFAQPEATQRPNQINIGTITEVSEAKITEQKPGKPNYIMLNVTLTPSGAGRPIKDMVLLRPEWLKAGFVPNFRGQEGERSLSFVYQNNINPPSGSNKLSKLQGLAGSREAFETFAGKLLSLPEQADGHPSLEDITGAFQDFFLGENQGVVVGYITSQRKEDQVETDENGEAVTRKILTDRMEVSRYYYPTEEAIKRWAKSADSNPDRYQMTFDTEQDLF